MEITNPNYNTMPEQVNQNTKDIAVLKNTVKTPAIIYNATIEMLQDAGVINKSNIMQQVTNTANAFVLDTVGKLFRIVTVQNDQVYVAYCASITGPQGTPGADGVGIQSITSIAPTQDNGYTVTPVTFTDTNGNRITLNVRAKNGEYAQVDDALSNTSENPVQNKIITNALNKKLEYKGFAIGSVDNIKTCGIYNYDGYGTTGIPTGFFGWGVLFVVNGSGEANDYWIHQILIANTGTPRIAMRNYITADAAWSGWYTL